MLEEELNHVGYSAIVICVFPNFQRIIVRVSSGTA